MLTGTAYVTGTNTTPPLVPNAVEKMLDYKDLVNKFEPHLILPYTPIVSSLSVMLFHLAVV